jgi:hypothetical protein
VAQPVRGSDGAKSTEVVGNGISFIVLRGIVLVGLDRSRDALVCV